MPFKEVDAMSLRKEFIQFAIQENANISLLCRQYGITRGTGYKLLQRYQEQGSDGLYPQSRRPDHSPTRTPAEIEQLVIDLRLAHPRWGGRKIHHYLRHKGFETIPAPSTITDILRRNNIPLEGINGSLSQKKFIRFEHKLPNDLWQMDFKGYVKTTQGLCHPLTILDDHSRFNVCLMASPNQRETTVQQYLIDTFRQYGLPTRINVDNGSPWGNTHRDGRYSTLALWMMRHGIRLSYSAPYHPQTNGKDERFHRTLASECLDIQPLHDLEHAQERMNHWRHIYNMERPHEALGMKAPISRYVPSCREFPEQEPVYEYDSSFKVRKTNAKGDFSFKGHTIRIGKAFHGQHIGISQDLSANEELYQIYYYGHKVAQFSCLDTAVRL